jgi:hypothetical protein
MNSRPLVFIFRQPMPDEAELVITADDVVRVYSLTFEQVSLLAEQTTRAATRWPRQGLA